VNRFRVAGGTFVLGLALTLMAGMAGAKIIASPGWYLQPSAPREDTARADAISRAADPHSPLTACADDMARLCPGLSSAGQRSCLSKQGAKLSAMCRESLAAAPPASSLGVPVCVDSTVCSPGGDRGSRPLLFRGEG
jgi:hypothetical protein